MTKFIKFDIPELISEGEIVGYEAQEVSHFFDQLGHGAKWATWFNGQTGGVTKDGKFVIYEHDFRRFCEQIGILMGDKNES